MATLDLGEFNHAEAKENYLKTMNTLYSTNCSVRHMNRNSFGRLFRMIFTAKHNAAFAASLSGTQKQILKIFDIIKVDHKRKLIKARKSENEPIREYVPVEDAFEILMTAHRNTSHGNIDQTMRFIQPNYVISRKCAEVVLKLCPCHENKSESSIFGSKYYVFILDMISAPDGAFNNILIVRDSATGFTHLRPLIASETMEVAIELFQIFADFGPPAIMEVKSIEFFLEVYQMLLSLGTDYDIKIVSVKVSLQDWANQVETLMNDWSNEAQTKNWAAGCLIAQWRINNTQEKNQKRPFDAVFGFRACDPLKVKTQKTSDKESDNKVSDKPTSESINVPSLTAIQINQPIVRPEIPVPALTLIKKRSSLNKSPSIPPEKKYGRPENKLQDKNVASISGSDFESQFEQFVISARQPPKLVPIDSGVVENRFQGDSSKISLVTVDISDNEMDVDEPLEEVKAIVFCAYCNKEMDEISICQRCKKPVHESCCKKLKINNESGLACILCLVQVKKRIELLKKRVKETSDLLKKKI